MKTLISKQQMVVRAIVMGAVLTTFGVSAGHTQEKHRIAGKLRAENIKYTQQHTIDVGDVPGHHIRIFELRYIFTQSAPLFEGVRARERWTRGFTDMINQSGSGEVYSVYLLENGDKVFAKGKTVVQAAAGPDESTRSKATYVSIITGGTGKLLGIRGVIEVTGVIAPKAGFAEFQFTGEYWLQK